MILIILGLLSTQVLFAKDKLGLLIIAHGAPMQQWNKPVLELENSVRLLMEKQQNDPFVSVHVALMEFNEPSINTVVKEMEKEGVEQIYAIPLFIAPSGHSLYDIPTILGLYSDKKKVKEIEDEGTKIVNTKIKITVGPTLYYGDIIEKIMLDRVKKLSINPEDESLVLLAHGDKYFREYWENMCQEVGSYIISKTGINYFDYAFVEIGQSFMLDGMSAISKALEHNKNVVVAGIYLSMGTESMAQNSSISSGMMKMKSKDMLADKNVIFSKHGLLPDKRITRWIVKRAVEWAE